MNTKPPAQRRAVKSILLSLAIFLIALALSILFQRLDVEEHITTVFVFAVFLISLITDGYICGLLSAIAGVLAVNYVFTYPYFTLSFNLSVNLISAIIMITLSILTGMLTTKIKKYEAERAKAERERMRANLLRAVSHDLRSPLTTIYSASSTLRTKKELLSPAQQALLLESIEADAAWLTRMVENLLSITRISNEQLQLQKSPVIVDELVDSVMTKFLSRYPAQAVSIDLPEQLVLISVDPILIEQVLMNLLENAVLHAEHMTRLSLHVFALGQKVIFEIADDGCGIPPDRLRHLFTGACAAQSHAADSKKRNLGIGLSVCATIIQAHGGEITAENRKTGGALFRFTLRKEDAPDDEQ